MTLELDSEFETDASAIPDFTPTASLFDFDFNPPEDIVNWFNVEKVIDDLCIYPRFQIQQLTKKHRGEKNHNAVFVEKIQTEIHQTEAVMQGVVKSEGSKWSMNDFKKFKIPALS